MSKNLHESHPSVVLAKKSKSYERGKDAYIDAVSDHEQSEPEKDYNVIPSSIEEDRLKAFSHSGEKYFKILVDNIAVYKDKYFQISMQNDPNIAFKKEDVIPGTYVTNKIVLFGAPYNLYCDAKDVEPVDIDHKAYLHRQREMEMAKKHNIGKNRNDGISDDNKGNKMQRGGNIDIDHEEKQSVNKVVDLDEILKDKQDERKDFDDDYKIDENAKLIEIDANKQKDPSLSDYVMVHQKQQNGDDSDVLIGKKKNVKKGYSKVGNQSDIDDDEEEETENGDGPIIIMKKEKWFRKYPYNICVFCLLFVVILILDILLIVFLNNLAKSIQAMDSTVCNEEELDLVYHGKYITVAIVGLIGLILFGMMLYFGPMIANKDIGILMVKGITVMMMVLYLSISGWQMVIMKNEINEGIDGLENDTRCNIEGNGEYIEDIKDEYNAVNIVTILKLLQAIVLCLLCVTLFCLRSNKTKSSLLK